MATGASLVLLRRAVCSGIKVDQVPAELYVEPMAGDAVTRIRAARPWSRQSWRLGWSWSTCEQRGTHRRRKFQSTLWCSPLDEDRPPCVVEDRMGCRTYRFPEETVPHGSHNEDPRMH